MTLKLVGRLRSNRSGSTAPRTTRRYPLGIDQRAAPRSRGLQIMLFQEPEPIG